MNNSINDLVIVEVSGKIISLTNKWIIIDTRRLGKINDCRQRNKPNYCKSGKHLHLMISEVSHIRLIRNRKANGRCGKDKVFNLPNDISCLEEFLLVKDKISLWIDRLVLTRVYAKNLNLKFRAVYDGTNLKRSGRRLKKKKKYLDYEEQGWAD